jgi:hypothetical protein
MDGFFDYDSLWQGIITLMSNHYSHNMEDVVVQSILLNRDVTNSSSIPLKNWGCVLVEHGGSSPDGLISLFISWCHFV